MTRWGKNPFWADVTGRLARQEAEIDLTGLAVDQAAGLWTHSVGERAAPPAFLQGRRLAADVSDRSVTLYPLGLAGRYLLHPGFDFGGFTVGGLDFEPGSTRHVRELVYGIGEATWRADDWEVAFRVSTTLPVLEMAASGAPVTGSWVRSGPDAVTLDVPRWLEVCDTELDPVVSRNNSAIPDPLPLPMPRAGVLAVPYPGRIVLVAARTQPEATALAESWEQVRYHQLGYWARVSRELAFALPDQRVSRQARYSLHSSLFSRSVDAGGRDIFVHGRRDRGYADTAHLHQSYQMHLPALAAGETLSVREELLSFLRLQDETGWIERAPRPIRGDSTYVGRYTGAHLLMAAERYLAWTGDEAFFDEPVRSDLDPVPRTVRDRIGRAAEDLLSHRFDGLLQPCGWADAWNPEVRAQGQISAAAVIGLRAWARVCDQLRDETAARRWKAEAEAVAEAMRTVLLDPETGIVAEHVFDDRVAGGTREDFWAHTQVWSALAGVTRDGRGLDLVEQTCLRHGVSIAPESAFDTDYIGASTDSEADLPLDSTATWLLASWPEVTHLYALAELERGRPDAALRAVLSQLPEELHGHDPACLPWYYAEKYLWPGTRPWLCTWAGDPSLLEVLLTGFFGVHAAPGGLAVAPRLPSAWRGRELGVGFVWRGRRLRLELDPTLPEGVLRLGTQRYHAGEMLPPDAVQDGAILRASSQTIA